MINALRFLTIDAVQKANSGHPGMPMGMPEVATALWQRHLHHNPGNDQWINRDRFVLSNGHGSMLLYSLLHLTGYDLPIDELKRFRQLHSKTPGHPEYGITPGVDTSTGPLGQGLGNAVGLALAERLLASEFNRAGLPIVDHYTYCFVGDGCLMEGISHEVCSLAGTWRLSKLIVFYDDNGISIDGHVEGWFTDNTPQRFAAYGWHVIDQIDGHDVEQVDAAIRAAKAQQAQPTIIICKTTIGKGAPNKAGTHDIHGSPLGAAEIAATRAALNWPYAPFELPHEIYQAWDARERGAVIESAWNLLFSEYQTQHPTLAAEFKRRIAGRLPDDFSAYAADCLGKIDLRAETIASRKSSQNALQSFAEKLPELLGGSADLAPSNLTQWKGCKSVTADDGGNYLHYGVREFGMVAIMSGLLLHRGLRPFGGTFAMFSDYARNAMRMAALMKINPIYVLTHDSIALGEDGPTHQPVEQVASLRLIPNMDVWRPCDAVESAVAWQIALEAQHNPTCLILSRQNLPHQTRNMEQRHAIARGAYILAEASDALGALSAVIIATGSEVQLAVQAQSRLAAKGIAIRVVSMPSTFCFERQPAPYQESVLPHGVPRVVIEAGVRAIWTGWAGDGGQVIGVDTFGESAPADVLAAHFGMTVEALVTAVEKVISDK